MKEDLKMEKKKDMEYFIIIIMEVDMKENGKVILKYMENIIIIMEIDMKDNF